MKKRLIAATALPLISFSVNPPITAAFAAEMIEQPVLLAQTEEQTCDESSADCPPKDETAPTSETAPQTEEVPTETQPEVKPDEETAPDASAPSDTTTEEPAPETETTTPQSDQAEPAEAGTTPDTTTEQTDQTTAPADGDENAPIETEEPAATEPSTLQSEPAATEDQPAETAEEPPVKEEPQPKAEASTEEDTSSQTSTTTEEAPAEEPKPATTDNTTQTSEKPALRTFTTEKSAEELPVENGAPILDSAKEPQTTTEEPEAQPRLLAVPESDADAQAATSGSSDGSSTKTEEPAPPPRSALRQEGQRLEAAPRYEEPEGDVVDQDSGRLIVDFGNGISIRFNDGKRVERNAQDHYYESLPGGYTRQVVERRNGDKVVTIRNRWGDIVQRSRIHDGREYILYYDPEGYDGERNDRRDEDRYYDPGRDLPPMRLAVPLDDYIIDTSSDEDRDYEAFLAKPPVEPVERIYSLDEVRHSARIRDKVRRIDLDTINFETGSAAVSIGEAKSLREVAGAINDLLKKDPGETFLIEGHTDAVGSDRSNLILSDKRAESVAEVLTDLFDVPPENLATQGYGERYLKVKTDGPEALNRRVTIRRVSPLVRPASAKVVQD